MITHRVELRGNARTMFASRAGEVCLVGPAGTGKSIAVLEKANALALLHPGSKGLICRKVQASLPASTLASWRKHVVKDLLRSRTVIFHGGGPQDPPQYRYANGSTINVGGLDKPSKIMSTEYDFVIIDEATELVEADLDAITSRLRNWVIPFQQVVMACNPDRPDHWLKTRGDAGKTLMLTSTHADNPALYGPDGTPTERGVEYLAKLANLSGVRRLRLMDGLWAAADGLIYDELNPAVHFLDSFPIPDDWPRVWSVDFGFTNPMVVQQWATDPDGRMYLYREWYRTQRLVEDMAADVLKVVAPDGIWAEPKPRKIVCDHDAEDRATLTKHLGMSTIAARKTVSTGLQAVKARLKVAGDGKPRLFILRGAVVSRDPDLVERALPTSTADEIAGYVWAPSPDGKPSKEEPLKENDHGMDAMRYAVMHLDHAVFIPKIRMVAAR